MFDQRFSEKILRLIVQQAKKTRIFIRNISKQFLLVHWSIFLLQVLHVEDVIVLIIFHYLPTNHYNVFDYDVIEHRHLQVSKQKDFFSTKNDKR